MDLDFILETMRKNDIKIEEKEMKKIERLGNKESKITRFLLKTIKRKSLIIFSQGRLFSLCKEQQGFQNPGGDGDLGGKQTQEQRGELTRHTFKKQKEC